jgi:hypothetical protein
MKRLIIVASIVGAVGIARVSAADTFECSAQVGEIRAFAIGRLTPAAVSDMHQKGWLEARGQVVSVERFPELYRIVGRDWTAKEVREEQFAIPDVGDVRFQRTVDTDNAYRALGPGDIITGGRIIKSSVRQHPISYWIFAGHPVNAADDGASSSR